MTTAYRFAGLPGTAQPSAPPGRASSGSHTRTETQPERGPDRASIPGHEAAAGQRQAVAPGPHWLTSSFGDSPSALARPPGTLDQHLSLCRHRHSRLAAMACGAESVHRFIAARFVTTLALALLVIGIALLVL